MKTCGKCKAEKPKNEFNKDASRRDGLQPKCKACKAGYYAANKDLIAKRMACYYAERKEKFAKYNADYNRSNIDLIRKKKAQYYAENKDRIATQRADLHAANPEKCYARNRNRRARKRNAEGRHSAADVRRIFEHQRGLCANCKVKLIKSGKNKYHMDHIVALARGGSNWPSNLQCLCPPCNVKKSAKDPIDWARENGRLI